jgi:hypothetical protein
MPFVGWSDVLSSTFPYTFQIFKLFFSFPIDSTLLYIFSYTFTPEFCFNNEKTYPGCTNTSSPYYSFWGSQLTTHGRFP